MRPEAVVFDIGKVLIQWDPEGFYDRVIGPEARARLFAAVDLHGMNHRIDLGEGFLEPVAACAAQHPDWAPEIMLWHDRWIEMVPGPVPGTADLLRALRSSGVPVLALTNFGTGTLEIARRHFAVLSEFDQAFVSAELRMVKPDPAIYAAVERGSGIAPDRLLFTDDRPENVAAAAARGWQVHRFETAAGLRRRLVAAGLIAGQEAG